MLITGATGFIGSRLAMHARRAGIDVLATGREYVLQPPEVCARVRQQYEQDFFPGRYEWPAFLRYLDRSEPDYAS